MTSSPPATPRPRLSRFPSILRSRSVRAGLTSAAVLATVLLVAAPATADPTPTPAVASGAPSGVPGGVPSGADASAAAASAAAASAAANALPVHIDFKLAGALTFPGLGGSAKLDGGVLSSDVNLITGAITGTANLPDTTVVGTLFGFIPLRVLIGLSQTSPLTGTLSPTSDVTVELRLQMSVRSFLVFGTTPLTTGSCQVQPQLDIVVVSDGKGHFRPLTGGAVTGKFATGALVDCGSMTTDLSPLVQNDANTINADLIWKQ